LTADGYAVSCFFLFLYRVFFILTRLFRLLT
jgi:hypothetical protein